MRPIAIASAALLISNPAFAQEKSLIMQSCNDPEINKCKKAFKDPPSLPSLPSSPLLPSLPSLPSRGPVKIPVIPYRINSKKSPHLRKLTHNSKTWDNEPYIVYSRRLNNYNNHAQEKS